MMRFNACWCPARILEYSPIIQAQRAFPRLTPRIARPPAGLFLPPLQFSYQVLRREYVMVRIQENMLWFLG
jgi:hypothetical protein